jgi:hypothetical protein
MAFFESIIGAGAILCGFCGTFLAFRIQREANYYRQPIADFESGRAKDVLVGLTHFSGPFLLLVVGSVCATLFGFLLPLIALGGAEWIRSRPNLVVGGLVATLVLIVAYFWVELIHYRIVGSKLEYDSAEWKREKPIVVGGAFVAVLCAILAYFALPGSS